MCGAPGGAAPAPLIPATAPGRTDSCAGQRPDGPEADSAARGWERPQELRGPGAALEPPLPARAGEDAELPPARSGLAAFLFFFFSVFQFMPSRFFILIFFSPSQGGGKQT